MQSVLEMFVQSIKETIRETPEEEQDGDQRDGVHRFAQCDLGPVPFIIARAQRSLFPKLFTQHYAVRSRRKDKRKVQTLVIARDNPGNCEECKETGAGCNLYKTCLPLHAYPNSNA